MAVYFIASLEVTDENLYREYAVKSVAIVEAHGGKIIAADRSPTVWEGANPAQKAVLIHFPSAEQAERWYRSPENAEAVQMRAASTANSFLMSVKAL